jgi:RNA polymerase sigma-70 factor (ECF subfamily)
MVAVAATAMAALPFASAFGWEERLIAQEIPEAALARAAARGDRTAFGRLVDLHKRSVYGLCLRLLRHGEEARDAAQETFVRGYAAISSYDASQPFAPWILRIARNHCLDLIRRRIPAAAQVALDAAPDGDGPVRELADVEAPSADALLERAQTGRALEAAVARLPDRYREVIQLFHVEQLSYKEIATTLDVPMGTVMTWLHRARGQLRRTLEAQALEGQRMEARP